MIVLFTKKERKAAKYFMEFVPNAEWIQRSWYGKLYLLDGYNEIIAEINSEKFKNVGNGQTWSLKTISSGEIK